MQYDILDLSSIDISNFSTVQMQLLRTAQKNKNELRYKLEQEMKMFEQIVLANDVYHSSLIESKRKELEDNFDYQVAIIAEQLDYALALNEPYPDQGDVNEETGYIVDYSLSYTDRYVLVRDYYLSIPDPTERMALYRADGTAKKYLGSYYNSLYDVLHTYSK